MCMKMGFLPSLYPGFPPRPIKHRAARLQGWLAMGPSLSSSPLGSAHLRFPWLHTTLISLQKCNILCIIVSSYGLSGFILSKALCWLQKIKKEKRRKIKCTVGEFYSKTRCPWKTKHQYLSSGVTRDRCIQCYKKAKQNKKTPSTLLPESLIWRLTGNLHFYGDLVNLPEHTGPIAIDKWCFKAQRLLLL